MKRHHTDAIERVGFAVMPDLVPEELRRELVALFDASEGGSGRRNGLASEAVRAAAGSATVGAVVRAVLGDGAFAVKATLFDKTRISNWLVPWHQDVVIPVRERRATPGFHAWSTKGGIPHVRPPARVLESMLAVRLDLDGSTRATGPLRVIPSTHNRGILAADEVQEIRRSETPVECLVPPSGGLVMRPLILHASSKASEPCNRRIVHIEFATDDLPGGLDWFHRHAIKGPPNQAM